MASTSEQTLPPKAPTGKRVDPEDRPNSWTQDNIAVCSVIAKTVHLGNIRYIRNFEDNAFGTWEALAKAHQYHTLGGQTYWLRKLTLARMTSDDVNAHLEEMGRYFKNLNSLVSTDRPLTLYNIYSTSLLISLPSDWLPCVSAIMNEEQVPSSRVIAALKQEALRRKSRTEDEPVSITLSKAILQNHTSHRRQEDKSSSNSKGNQGLSKRSEKAGKTTVVEIGGDYTSNTEDLDYFGSSVNEGPGPAASHNVSVVTNIQLCSMAQLPTSPPTLSPLRVSTPDLPPLDIPLQPRFDQRLQESIHAPGNDPEGPSQFSPEPQTHAPHPMPCNLPEPEDPPPSDVLSPPEIPPLPSLPSLPPSSAPPRKSTQNCRPPDRLGNWSKSAKTTPQLDTPKTWNQLLKSPNQTCWLKAADEEYGSLVGMSTWKLAPRPAKQKVIWSRKNGVQPLHAALERRAGAARLSPHAACHVHAYNRRAYGVQACQTGVQSLHACLKGVQSLHALRTGVQALHACRLT
ncbi:hypothetical protein PCANC_24934 [Puccinia coronata f. sp. avenae]|uniref:Uncharacterized protein n=1 Tax=Puccinia coronata f. sp. avenae TaxID=200324 RepID=A0A2N5S7V4_9BASI|nr:hypothetical protein PCANC_24934 [Puccinia coronata f. sp. avenae]